MFIGTYETEDIKIQLSCDGEETDYGVPRSPVFWEPNLDTIRIDSIELFGEELPVDRLPERLKDAILSLDVEFVR